MEQSNSVLFNIQNELQRILGKTGVGKRWYSAAGTAAVCCGNIRKYAE
jgi:hypothetical protein